jgi:hypothetical protein
MITLAEFKSWMRGVEDMQKPDWHPTKTQWQHIRSKIELLEDTVQPAAPQLQYPAYPPQYQYHHPSDLSGAESTITYTNGDTPTFL